MRHHHPDNTYEALPRLRLLRRAQNKACPAQQGAVCDTLTWLCCSVVARNNDILKRLVLEAKREYEKDAEHRVHIFMADT